MAKLNSVSGGRVCACGKHPRSVSHMTYENSPEPTKKGMMKAAYKMMVQDEIAAKGRKIAELEDMNKAMLEALTPVIRSYGGEAAGKTYAAHTYSMVPVKTEIHKTTGFEIRTPETPRVKSIPNAKTYEQLYWNYVRMPTDNALATDKALRDLISVVNLKTEHIVDTVRKAPKKAIDASFPFIAGFIGMVLGISLAWIIVIFTHI